MGNEKPDFVNRLITLAGGAPQVRRLIEDDQRRFNEVWDRDTDLIGRVLRAHLTVEHFMTQCIAHDNPRLGSMREARLTFAQKVALLDDSNAILVGLRPGVQRLNALRNDLAHRLSRPLEPKDVAPFLEVALFRELRNALAETSSKKPKPKSEPIDILEEFVRYASTMLGHKTSAFGNLVDETMKLESSRNEPGP